MDSLIGRKREVDELKRLYISARSDKITLFAEICLQNLCSSKKKCKFARFFYAPHKKY